VLSTSADQKINKKTYDTWLLPLPAPFGRHLALMISWAQFLQVYELLDKGDCFHTNLTLINSLCQVYILVSQFRGIQQILKLSMLLLKNIITWFYLNEHNQLQFK